MTAMCFPHENPNLSPRQRAEAAEFVENVRQRLAELREEDDAPVAGEAVSRHEGLFWSLITGRDLDIEECETVLGLPHHDDALDAMQMAFGMRPMVFPPGSIEAELAAYEPPAPTLRVIVEVEQFDHLNGFTPHKPYTVQGVPTMARGELGYPLIDDDGLKRWINVDYCHPFESDAPTALIITRGDALDISCGHLPHDLLYRLKQAALEAVAVPIGS